jgi:hypothetical protein
MTIDPIWFGGAVLAALLVGLTFGFWMGVKAK